MCQKRSRTAIAVGVSSLVVAAVLGCADGIGSLTADPSLSTKKAVRSSCVGDYQSLVAGANIACLALAFTAPTKAVSDSAKTVSDRFSPTLSLYSRLAPRPNGFNVTFFKDAHSTSDVGSVAMTAASGSLKFCTYPATVVTDVNVSAGNIPCHGRVTTVYTDQSGASTMSGTLTLPNNNEEVALDLALTATHAVSGTFTMKASGVTTVANVSGPLTGDLALAFKAQPTEYDGSGIMSLKTGKIKLRFAKPKGAAADMNSDGCMQIAYPDGTSEKVASPITAALLTHWRGLKFWESMRKESQATD